MGALGRDTPGWRVKNGCSACSYQVRHRHLAVSDPLILSQLEGEDPPKYDRIVVMDGNNSLKRVATSGGRQMGDLRVYEDGDYFLSRDFVDSFASEVKSRQSSGKPEVPDTSDPIERDQDEDEPAAAVEAEGDPTDGATGAAAPSPCASNWKAAAADEKKRMWAVYDETGIFASACRHGLILWIADMVQSGELYVSICVSEQDLR